MRKLYLAFFIMGLLVGCTDKVTPPLLVEPVVSTKIDTLASNVSYALTNHPRQKLDIIKLRSTPTPAPAVLCIHGGGWIAGDRVVDNTKMCWNLLKAGMIIVPVDYRLSTDAIWPAQINDIKAAIRFLRAKSTQYGIDKTRIGCTGGSAGGHLCAIAVVAPNALAPDLSDLSLGYSRQGDRLQAGAPFFAPMDFSTRDAEFQLNTFCSPDPTDHDNLLKLMGVTEPLSYSDSLWIWSASPVTRMKARVAPIQIWQGYADCTVPWQQAVDADVALTAINSPHEVHFTSYGHGGPQWISDTSVVNSFVTFFKVTFNIP